ncbi:MAG: oxidoreductase [Deltaproteobacteria bacterium]|nr:oxidoreductase [Deltaproteobacteria bacterium]
MDRSWESLRAAAETPRRRAPDRPAAPAQRGRAEGTGGEVTHDEIAALLPHASERQREVLEALQEHGSQRAAARALKISYQAVQHVVAAVKKKAARTDPQQHRYQDAPLPAGYHIHGVSEMTRNALGDPKWIKSSVDKDAQIEALLRALKEACEDVPAVQPVPAPAVSSDDLLCVYPMGDPHVGMYAWAEETGASYDLAIAEALLFGAVDHLVALAPAGTDALLLNLGDFFHSDHQGNTTRKSGHQLDVDSRWSKVLRCGIRIVYRQIDRALERHRRVQVRNEIGNHDDHTSILLSLALEQRYRDEPRVQIDTSPAKFFYREHGQCLIGSTHLDTVKPPQLPGIMAVDQREAWGRTRHRQWYTGHVHHQRVKDYPGCTVETFRTTAAADAWHAGQGYRSERDMRLDIWHRRHGLTQRHIVGVEQLVAP